MANTQSSMRMDVETVSRLDALIPRVTERQGMTATRPVVLRVALMTGLERMEQELRKHGGLSFACGGRGGKVHVAFWADTSVLERAELVALASRADDVAFRIVTRSDVLREAVRRGLDLLERGA